MLKPKFYKILTFLLVICFTFSVGVKPVNVNAASAEVIASIDHGLSDDNLQVFASIVLYAYASPYIMLITDMDPALKVFWSFALFSSYWSVVVGSNSDPYNYVVSQISFSDEGYLTLSRNLIQHFSGMALYCSEFFIPGTRIPIEGLGYIECYSSLPVYDTEYLSSVDELVLNTGSCRGSDFVSFLSSAEVSIASDNFSSIHVPIDHYSESLNSGLDQFVTAALAALAVAVPVLGLYCVIRLIRRIL